MQGGFARNVRTVHNGQWYFNTESTEDEAREAHPDGMLYSAREILDQEDRNEYGDNIGVEY